MSVNTQIDMRAHSLRVILDNQHDNGAKTIYAGTPYQASGNLSGEDVITVIGLSSVRRSI